MPKIGRTLSKVEGSDGGTESMNVEQTKEPEKYKLAQTPGRNIPAVAAMNGTTQEVVRSMLWLDHGKDSTCSPLQHNVAFIKTHKTGSTSIGHLINRFGYHHRLSFVLNKHSRINGHLVYYNITKNTAKLMFLPPINVKPRDYKHYKYNVIAVHVRYMRPAMTSFMKPGTKYITILRDPGSQFESAFSHFKFDDAFPLEERRNFNTTVDKLEHFLTKPIFYRDRLKVLSWENTPGLLWFYARNNQAFDLGLDHKYHMNTSIVEKFINRLEREMTVVLLTEYLDESLLILRKKMCWTWSDILYVAKNRRPEVETLPELLREKMRSWNAVDSMLYNNFNRTLWKHVEEYGQEFASDLAFFKEMLVQVFNECVLKQYKQTTGRGFHWIEYQQRQGSSSECELLVETKRKLFSRIWKRQSVMRRRRNRKKKKIK
ncbi:galactosylceramide sulfotransferase-like [Anneissia japonica]|uniref:galactosylceramide sulfotransferase-like n=1 Tax=Anneissia japonica TaxID=1529436 RepID=UPI001425B05B|nr:galactosylceramide sulfotransferase-like [Anneissia japonica]